MPKVVPAATPAFSVTSVKVPSRLFLYKRVSQRLFRRVEIARAAVDQVNVHPAVVIVIQESAAGAQAFRQITLRRLGVLVHPRYAAGLGRYFFEDGAQPEPARRATTFQSGRFPPVRRPPEAFYAKIEGPTTQYSVYYLLGVMFARMLGVSFDRQSLTSFHVICPRCRECELVDFILAPAQYHLTLDSMSKSRLIHPLSLASKVRHDKLGATDLCQYAVAGTIPSLYRRRPLSL